MVEAVTLGQHRPCSRHEKGPFALPGRTPLSWAHSLVHKFPALADIVPPKNHRIRSVLVLSDRLTTRIFWLYHGRARIETLFGHPSSVTKPKFPYEGLDAQMADQSVPSFIKDATTCAMPKCPWMVTRLGKQQSLCSKELLVTNAASDCHVQLSFLLTGRQPQRV